MRFFYWSLLVFALTACSVPSAAPEEEPSLVIATDHTSAADSILFRKFEKQFDAKVKIRQMSADSLINLFSKGPYNTGIDVVIMHQLYDMRKLTQKNIFETIELDELTTEGISNSPRTIFGIGIDPFIAVTKSDFRWDINIYDDLSKTQFINNFSQKSQAHFFAPFEQKMTRAKTFNRIQKILDKSIEPKNYKGDSVDVILCSYSQYLNRSPKDSLWNDYSKIHFPNSKTSGVFYDLISIGIVDQSSHYDLSVQFLNWINQKSMNKEFNKRRGYLSYYDHPQFSIYVRNPTKLMQYHVMMERMLKELQ